MRGMTVGNKLLALFLLAVVACGMSSCAGAFPGGSDSTNKGYYNNPAELKEWASSLEAGMGRDEVFARLGRVKTDLKILSREETMTVLFGGRNGGVPITFNPGTDIKTYLESVEGYRLEFKDVKRRHGFTSPIRIRTDESGYDYTLNLIFREGRLIEKPVLQGGIVNKQDSSTLFDYLNPGTILNASTN